MKQGMRRVAALMLVAGAEVAAAGPVLGQGTWETTLQARDINHDGTVDAYYDTALNITWLADANLGSKSWSDGQAEVASLNVYGVTGWRLPKTTPVNGIALNLALSVDGSTDFGYNTSSSELAHMFYVTLGNAGYVDTSNNLLPAGSANSANFVDYSTINYYWSGTERSPGSNKACYFLMQAHYGGLQACDDLKSEALGIWAVYDGDVPIMTASSLPEPQTPALALLALGAMAAALRPARHRPKQ